MVRWDRCECSNVQGGKGRRVVMQQGGKFLFFFKSERHRVSPRFHLFVSDVYHQQNERAG